MRLRILGVLLIAPGMLACARARPDSANVRGEATADSISSIKAELARLYDQNTAAFLRWDFAGVMALRAPDFHAITPDGAVQDRPAMERYIQGVMNGIKKWNSITFTIDSLRVAGDTAFAIVTQHLDAWRSDRTTRCTTWRLG